MTTILLLKRNWLIYGLISHNVHLGISLPQKHPPFLENPPFIVFVWTNLQNQLFQWTPINYNFLSLIPTPSFKSNQILSLNWQRKTFLSNFFLVKYFRILLFSCKNYTPHPPEKPHIHFPQQPPFKNCDHVKHPPSLFFENMVGDSTPQQKWRGSHCFPDIQYLFGASKISDFWASTVSYWS